jgi:hypothetical protein
MVCFDTFRVSPDLVGVLEASFRLTSADGELEAISDQVERCSTIEELFGL